MFAFRFLGATLVAAGVLSASAIDVTAATRTAASAVALKSVLSTPWREHVLHFFGDRGVDGTQPRAGLIGDSTGALYGTASAGGAHGHGTVFKLTPPGRGQDHWTETVLHAFSGPDGADPEASLLTDARGALYGTTAQGGGCPGFRSGCGTVFELTPPAGGRTAWTESVLHVFTGVDDGAFPYAGLIADMHGGALYGTTYAGGSCPSQSIGCGTVFQLSPPAPGKTGWTESVLHAFADVDGSNPLANLVADSRGALYGTTIQGGGCYLCRGTVFRLTPPSPRTTAWVEDVLHTFGNDGYDGGWAMSGLTADARGDLYGTTSSGAGGYACGTVFELTPPARTQTAWPERILHVFTCADGNSPWGGVIPDTHGALYGTTYDGGSSCLNCGTVFKLTPPARGKTSWTQSVLHQFTGADGGTADGANPITSLIADARGFVYGTTFSGGAHAAGTVFELQL